MNTMTTRLFCLLMSADRTRCPPEDEVTPSLSPVLCVPTSKAHEVFQIRYQVSAAGGVTAGTHFT